MTGVVLLGYLVGAAAGWGFSRSARVAPAWRVIIRVQLLLVSVFVSLMAAWRLNGLADLVWPLIGGVMVLLLIGAAFLVTPSGPERPGRAALRGWAVIPNGGYWVIPVATAIAGAPGAVFAVLIDRVNVLIAGLMTWSLRRYAPIKQRTRTSWIDQGPVIALLVRLVLNYFSDAPDWTATALVWTAPIMAMTGAAVFVGSVLHPSQRIAWRPGIRPWVFLVCVRVALFLPLAFLAPGVAMPVGFVLFAFSIPAFFPPQLSILYGYADPVVAAAVRWGWIFAPIGIVAAELAYGI